ncbi:MAG TPA: hypothetical protein VHX65_14955 [Pirellulales bacterium]|nr:hypothetical protein [Pirellulales bacterium]
MRLAIFIGVVILLAGCGLLPEVSKQPTIHNPFPQLTKVAIAPFINLSTDPSVDGREFGLAYFSELQLIPGFEVVPIGVVETAMRDNHLTLNSASDCRRLAQLLGVDAVVVGAITDFDPYYPPRCGLQVEWYAANPCFHPIPPGYGLPWGTPAEEDIPQPLVLETEFALARAQLKTQTPPYEREPPAALPARRQSPADDAVRLANGQSPSFQAAGGAAKDGAATGSVGSSVTPSPGRKIATTGAGGSSSGRTILAGSSAVSPNGSTLAPVKLASTTATAATPAAMVAFGPNARPGMPPDWPDPSGLIPPPPSCGKPECHPTDEPVLRHTRTYHANDPEFTAALRSYVTFRDDARFGGWASYLQRSDDFIRFCCHKHIAEMLTARGGAGQTRVLLRWSDDRYIP